MSQPRVEAQPGVDSTDSDPNQFDEFDIIRAYYDKKYGQKLMQQDTEPEVAA